MNVKRALRNLLGTCLVGVVGLTAANAHHVLADVSTSTPISHPTYVNIFWDRNWDADNPQLQQSTVNTLTSAVTNSSYVTQLAPYGVSGADFSAQAFVVDPSCWSGSSFPANLSLVNLDPQQSIQVVAGCEATLPDVPHGPNVIFNLFLAPGTVENDWPVGRLCSENPAVGFHFHSAVFGGRVFTVVPTAPACVGPGDPMPALFSTLTHEMVEAATNPFPGMDVVFFGAHEGADECESLGPVPFLAPLTTAMAASYERLGSSVCEDFMGRSTAPVISSANFGLGTPGGSPSFTLRGSDFGTVPNVAVFNGNSGATASIPGAAMLPYIRVLDQTRLWEAGDSLDNDTIGLTIAGWTDDTISVTRIAAMADGTVPSISAGDALEFTVCNPQSGVCSAPLDATVPQPWSGISNVVVPSAAIASNFTPHVISIDPSQGAPAGGNVIIIAGTNFAPHGSPAVSGVQFGSQVLGPCATKFAADCFTVLDDSHLRVVVPPYRGKLGGRVTVPVQVVAGDLESPLTAEAHYTYQQ